MCYIGCGIGHKVTEYIPQTRAGCVTETEVDVQEDLATDDVGNLEAEPHLDEHGADEDGEDGDDGNRNGDVEVIDSDEEADFGYRDSEDSQGEESDDEDNSEAEDDCV